MLSELGKNVEEVGRGDGQVRKDEGRGSDRNRQEWDGRGWAAAGLSVEGRVVSGVVGTVEEILDDLVGSGDVDLINVVDGRPRGDRECG